MSLLLLTTLFLYYYRYRGSGPIVRTFQQQHQNSVTVGDSDTASLSKSSARDRRSGVDGDTAKLLSVMAETVSSSCTATDSCRYLGEAGEFFN